MQQLSPPRHKHTNNAAMGWTGSRGGGTDQITPPKPIQAPK